MASAGIGSLRVDLGMNTAAFTDGIDLASRKMNGFAKQMQKTGAKMRNVGKGLTLGITAPLAAFGVQAAKTAIDAQEMESAFDVTFKGMAASARKWAEETGNAMGRSTQELQEGAMGFQMLFGKAMALEPATEMSKTFAVLTQDIASFRNLSNDVAKQKLMSGLAGEAEPLRAVGVFLSAAKVDAAALELGLKGVNGKLSEEQKIMARAKVIQDELKEAEGDVIRTKESTANKIKELQAAYEEMSVTIGTKLLPVLTPLVNKIASLVDWFGGLSDETQTWVLIVAGVAAAIGPVVFIIGSLVTGVGYLTTVIGALSKAMLFLAANPIIAGLALAIGLIYLAWKNWDKIKPIIDRIAKAVTDFWNKHVSPVFNFIWDGLKLVVGAWLGMYTGVWNVLKKLGSAVKEWLGDKLGVIFDGVRKKLKLVADLFFQLYDAVVGNSYIPDMVDEIGQNMDRLEKLMVDPAEKATKKVKEAFRDMASDALALMEQLFPLAAQMRGINKDLASLDEYQKAGLITAAQAADGRSVLLEERAKARGPVEVSQGAQLDGMVPLVDRLTMKLVELKEVTVEVPRALNQAQEKMVEFATYVGDSLMGGIFDVLTGRGSFKKVFSDLLGNVLNESIRTAMRSLETDLFGEKGLGGFLGSVLGGLFGGKRAAGGPVSAGKTFLVGEKGPELFSPSSGGKITPNSALTGGGGMTVNVDARGSTDPNAVRAEVERGILEAAPHIVAAAQSRTVRTLQRPRLAGMAR